MVLAYYPQSALKSLNSNTNYPPQESGPGVGIPGLQVLMEYEDLVDMAYEHVLWFDLDFQQRIPLTVQNGQVPSSQTNFPILINDTYPDLIGEVEAEIRIVNQNQVLLDYEIQKFDNSTGLLIAWARQPTLSDGDIFFIYFDNPGASDAQNITGVWDSTFAMVNHMEPSLLDSTSNDNDAVEAGGTNTTNITGKIGQGRGFNGIDTTLEILDTASLNITSAITLSAWVRQAADENGFLIGKDPSGTERPYSIRMNSNDGRFIIDTGSLQVLQGVGDIQPDNVFFHLVGTWDGTTMKLFINNAANGTFGATGSIIVDAASVFLGSFNNSSIFLDGEMDEVRISNVGRSDDYIETEFNNQNDTSTFYSTGAVENVSSVIIIDMEYEG